MRIAILGPFYPYRGGIAQFDARMYEELEKSHCVKAFTFTTLYPDFLFPGKTQYVSEEDTVSVVSSERVLSSINPITYFSTAREINKFKPDVLIIPYWMSFMAPAFGMVSRLINENIKIIAFAHNVMPHERRFFDKAFAQFFFNKCDGFVVMSDISERYLGELQPNAKVLKTFHPIYDHYDASIGREEACQKLGIKTDKKNLLFFGLIREYKGLDLLIKAVGELDDSYQLIIAGESYGDFAPYRELIDSSPLKSNIRVFEEYLPDEMVSVLFSATDVLVLPYRSATQSGVVAVAYQLEKPIIATNVGALGTMIGEAETGVVVSDVSVSGIKDGIERFFTGDYTSRYTEALKKEKARLSWANLVRSLETFISEL